MNLAPKKEGADIPLNGSLPKTLDEAETYINSKFPFIADSQVAYEEFEAHDGPVRAAHITYAFGVKLDGQDSVEDLIRLWLFAMMDAIVASKRQRIYWRMKPEITVERIDFPDGPAWALQLVSRSAMV